MRAIHRAIYFVGITAINGWGYTAFAEILEQNIDEALGGVGVILPGERPGGSRKDFLWTNFKGTMSASQFIESIAQQSPAAIMADTVLPEPWNL